MLIFPQLSTGASAQYPIQKIRSDRTILNISQDGQIIAISDSTFHALRWVLTLQNLTDAETGSLTSFFQLCEGPLQNFTFLDPTQNLFSYSEDLTQPAWQMNSLLILTTGITDPFGTTRASQLYNSSAGTLQLTQTIQIPGSTCCAFSAYLQSSQGLSYELIRTDASTVHAVTAHPTTAWTRFSLNNDIFASSTSTSCDFSISIPRGATLGVFGLQVDAQPMPGTYIVSTVETGVYPNARFDGNQLTITATGPDQSSAAFSIVSKASA